MPGNQPSSGRTRLIRFNGSRLGLHQEVIINFEKQGSFFFLAKNQCFGFGSGPGSELDPDSIRSGGSGSRRATITQKNKKVKKFHVLKCWMFTFLRVEGLSCILDVLYGGLGIPYHIVSTRPPPKKKLPR
jgi:hypothetical protein